MEFSGIFTKLVLMAAAVSVLVFTGGCESPSEPQALPEQLAVINSFNPKDNYIINHGAEYSEGNDVPFWDKAVIETEGLKLYRETANARSGRACFAISNTHKYEKIVTNSWYQDVLNSLEGQTVRLSAYIRAEAAQSAFVTAECISQDGSELTSTVTDRITLDQKDWVLVLSEPMRIPPQTYLVRVRASLTGTGIAWFDDLKLAQFEPLPDVVIEDQLKDAVDSLIVKAYPVKKDSMVIAYLPDRGNGREDNTSVANCYGGAKALFAWPVIEEKYIGNPNCRFVLAAYSGETTYRPPFSQLQARELLEDWPEIVSWQREPQAAETAFAEFELTDGNDWKLFDVTNFVREQIQAGRKNYGIQLRFAKEQSESWSGYRFVSRDSKPQDAHLRPKLLVLTKD